MRGLNKKGQEMTLGTIIAIILGLVVLVFLIFGFSTGWGNLWGKMTQYGGGETNLGTVKQACAIACSSGDRDNFCSFERTVKFGRDVEGLGEDCFGAPIIGSIKTCYATCDDLANNEFDAVKNIGVEKCHSITC